MGMECSRWEQLWELFHEALELPPVEQESFLDGHAGGNAELRADLDRLLKAHQEETGILGLGPGSVARPPAQGVVGNLLGKSLGAYRIVEVLGYGGMGVVYRAEQEGEIERSVAIKVIRLGMQSDEVIARFELERRALAIMDHPGIARLFDVGVTFDGRPYFVMEKVDGLPITQFADRERLGIGERVELFRKVCRAVEHAHQKGVLHRDLKPGNILVGCSDGEPQPRIIDFGIAKAIDQRRAEGALSTVLGRVVGTPEYMSPEQAEGRDIDTRSDVFSLGATLYELLLGELPFRFDNKPLAEVQRILRQSETPRASTRASQIEPERAADRGTEPRDLSRALRGDLDWILLKALDRDTERRYGSAAELASDLDRYLAREPILASPPSRWYRAKKFIERNRVPVAAALGVVLALLIGLATTLSMAWVATSERQASEAAALVAEQARQEAEREARRAQAVQSFLSEMLASPDPSRGGNTGKIAREVRVVDVLDDAAENLGAQFAEEPEVQAALRDTLGRTYAELGLIDEAQGQLEEALRLRRSVLGEAHRETLDSAFQVAALLTQRGDYETAEELLRGLLEQRRAVDGNDAAETLEVVSLLNDVLLEQGKVSEAASVYQQALEQGREVLGPDHAVTLELLNNLAHVLNRLGESDRAIDLHRESLERHERVLGPEHPGSLQARSNLGAALVGAGQLEEAETTLERAVEDSLRVLGPEHAHSLRTQNNLGAVLFRQENWQDAESLFRQVLSGYASTLDEGHPLRLVTQANIARAVAMQERRGEAEGLYRALLRDTKEHLPAKHPNVAVFTGGLGVCLFEMGRHAEAEPYLLESYERHQASYGSDHPRTKQGAERLADLYEAWGLPTQSARYRSVAASD